MSTERAPINVLLRSEQSGEQIAVMDNTVSAGFPRRPLRYHDSDETIYVLEGELTFQLGDEVFTRKAGELAFAPRNVPHTFASLSSEESCALQRTRVWSPGRPIDRCACVRYFRGEDPGQGRRRCAELSCLSRGEFPPTRRT